MENQATFCEICQMTFSRKYARDRHVATVHGEASYPCDTCSKIFKRKDDLTHHLKTHGEGFICQFCEKSFPSKKNKDRHEKTAHLITGPVKEFRCDTCFKSYTRKEKLLEHKRKCNDSSYTCSTCGEEFAQLLHFNRHRTTAHQEPKKRTSTTEIGPAPSKRRRDGETRVTDLDPINFEEAVTDLESSAVEEIYRENWGAIRTHFIVDRPVQDIFNFRESDVTQLDLLDIIFNSQELKFKINLSFGFILQHMETLDLRYFHASSNNARALDEPHTINNRQNFEHFIECINDRDFMEGVKQRRPSTKWIVERITNVTFYVNKIQDHPIGTPINLPDFIVDNPALNCLHKNMDLGVPYKDNLCLFRCLALWSGADIRHLERTTNSYYNQYEEVPKREFKGVKLNDLPLVRDLFKVNIMVYELCQKEDGEMKHTVAKLVKRSLEKYTDTMYMNLYLNHFSYIKDIELYSKSYACGKCEKLFPNRSKCTRHEQQCKKSIFEKLEEEGIIVPQADQFYSYRATFDFECYFSNEDLPENSEKRQFEARHIPLSVSVCSNVEGYTEPKCFITEGDSKRLVGDMVSYLENIAYTARTKMTIKHNSTYTQLRELIDEALELEPEKETRKKDEGGKHPLENLREEFDKYIKELPVLGFNSSRYDLNLIKRELIGYLLDHSDIKFSIKNNNSFLCVKTPTLKFMDIMSFLAPGYSYDKYLKAYGATAVKGFFPYEWMDSLEKLNFNHLPTHADFHSKLKNKNISNEDYAYCQQVWKDHNMTTFRDFTVWHNNLDVKPFLEAVEKQFDFYRELNIDMFKQAVSVPGITLKYLFSSLEKNIYFSLFNKNNSDLYHLIRGNVVGGPSIIFSRYQEKGVTPIHPLSYGENSKICQSVTGFDANALYLWAMAQNMPIGSYIRRKPEEEFKPVKSNVYGRMAFEWLEYISHNEGKHILHQFNGKEKQLGRRRTRVDGWHSETRTAYQLHGCFHHGDACSLNRGKDGKLVLFNKRKNQLMSDLYNDTMETSSYLKDTLKVTLIEIWECEWLQLQKENPEVNVLYSHSQNSKSRVK